MRSIILVVLTGLVLLACLAPVEKIERTPYDKLIDEGRYKEAVHRLCSDIEEDKGDGLDRFLSCFGRLREAFASSDEVVVELVTEEELAELEEELATYMEYLSQLIVQLAKEKKKNRQTLITLEGETSHEVRERILSFETDIRSVRREVMRLRGERDSLKLDRDIFLTELKGVENRLKEANGATLIELREKKELLEKKLGNLKKQIGINKENLVTRLRERKVKRTRFQKYLVNHNGIPDPEIVREMQEKIRVKRKERLDMFVRFIIATIRHSIDHGCDIDFRCLIRSYLKPRRVVSKIISQSPAPHCVE